MSLFSFCVCDSLYCCLFHLQVTCTALPGYRLVAFGLHPVCSFQFCAYLEVIDGRVDTEESHNVGSILDCMRFLHFTIPACVCSVEFCLGNTLHVHICTSWLRFLNFQVESQRPELLIKILNFFFFFNLCLWEWRSEASFMELIFFIYCYVVSKNRTQVVRSAWQAYLQSRQYRVSFFELDSGKKAKSLCRCGILTPSFLQELSDFWG